MDPGIGFAKGYDENIKLLHPDGIRRFKALLGDRPLLIGASRKRFLNRILSSSSSSSGEADLIERDLGTAGACCAAMMGGADFVRVHNVKVTRAVCISFMNLTHPFRFVH
jgi:dihydropteroate synthase